MGASVIERKTIEEFVKVALTKGYTISVTINGAIGVSQSSDLDAVINFALSKDKGTFSVHQGDITLFEVNFVLGNTFNDLVISDIITYDRQPNTVLDLIIDDLIELLHR